MTDRLGQGLGRKVHGYAGRLCGTAGTVAKEACSESLLRVAVAGALQA